MGAQTTVQLRGYQFGAGPRVWIDEEHLQFGQAEDRSTEQPEPNRDGVLHGGADRLGGRDLLVPVLVWSRDASSTKAGRILQAIDDLGDLAQAWRPAVTDLTLTLTLGGARTFVVYGRPKPRAASSLRNLHRGAQPVVLRFRMSRPYLFDAAHVETVVDVLSQVEAGGLGYPHGYPHGYGGEAAQGAATHTAGGRIRTWPLVVLRAGALDTLRNPTIVNDLTGKRLGLDTVVDSSAQLVVDMYRQRAYATQVGADVLGADPSAVALADRSAAVRHPTDNDWWDVGPEATPVRLIGEGAGTAHILTRGAYDL